MIQTWFKIFIRNIKAKPLYPIINTLGLVLGITSFILATLYVNHELSYEQWNPYKDIIYESGGHEKKENHYFNYAQGIMTYSFAEQNDQIEDFVAFHKWYRPLISFEDHSFYVNQTTSLTPNYFEFFPFPFKYGSPKGCLDHDNNIVLSEEIATKLFGNENPVGKIVSLHRQKEFTITGVFITEGYNSNYSNDIVTYEKKNFLEMSWGNHSMQALFKLKDPTIDIAQLEKDYTDFYIENVTREWTLDKEGIALQRASRAYILENLADMHLFSRFTNGKGMNSIIIISLLSLLILLISTINFINLSLSSATQRAKEVGIRKTIGATRTIIIKQFIFEVCIQVLLALLISFVLIEVTLPYFSDLLQTDIPLYEIKQSLPVLFVTLILLILFAGIFPAVYLAKFNPVKVLKGNFSRSQSGRWLKRGMLILQFSISTIFLIGTIIIHKQVLYMNNQDAGFKKERTLLLFISDGSKAFTKKDLYTQKIAQIKGVNSVTTTNRAPGTRAFQGSNTSIHYQTKENFLHADITLIDYDYFDKMKMEVIQGSAFKKGNYFDTITPQIMVNETFVNQLNITEPIGKKVNGWFDDIEITGVIKDVKTKGFQNEVSPEMYMVYPSPENEDLNGWMHPNTVVINLDSKDLSQTISAIDDFWTKEIEPGFPMEYEFLDENFAKLHEQHFRMQQLVFILSFIMIFLSLLGLFALATYSIQQRYKEVAIRKAIGASEASLISSLIKEFIIICFMASLFALPFAYFVSKRWLNDFYYRIEMPLIPYIAVPILIIFLTLLIVWGQARKALKVDLIHYLKYE